MFGKKGGLFGGLKEKANDAAERATGKDLDGDGDIGGVPIQQEPQEQHHEEAPATRAGGGASAEPDNALFGQIAQAMQDPQLQATLSGFLTSSGKVKPRAGGGGGLASLQGVFNSLPAGLQQKAEAQNEQLETGSNMELSTCDGRKRSLLIGINYPGTSAELKGCINDVKNIKAFITEKMSFPTDSNSMRVLVDDGSGDGSPTRANIIAGIKWLIEGAKSGDSLFMHYSGHGATQKDVSPDTDEADGQDETLVPGDYQTAGMIVDDDLFDMLVEPLPKGVRLTAIMDCCHSGSIFDLPYSYVLEAGKDEVTEIDNRKVAIAAAMAAGKALFAGDKAGALKNFVEAAKHGALAYQESQKQGGASAAAAPAANASGATNTGGLSTASNVDASAIHIRTTLADVIQFSGCKDEQTSADAFIGGESTGAMSYAFRKAFEDHGMDQTYAQLLRNIRTTLNGKYKQIPQMSVGHKMVNMESKFKM